MGPIQPGPAKAPGAWPHPIEITPQVLALPEGGVQLCLGQGNGSGVAKGATVRLPEGMSPPLHQIFENDEGTTAAVASAVVAGRGYGSDLRVDAVKKLYLGLVHMQHREHFPVCWQMGCGFHKDRLGQTGAAARLVPVQPPFLPVRHPAVGLGVRQFPKAGTGHIRGEHLFQPGGCHLAQFVGLIDRQAWRMGQGAIGLDQGFQGRQVETIGLRRVRLRWVGHKSVRSVEWLRLKRTAGRGAAARGHQ